MINAQQLELAQLEAEYPDGLTRDQILKHLKERHGVQINPASFHYYVRLGLLPQSVRKGQRGKHRGSYGIYPAAAIAYLLIIHRTTQSNITLEELREWFAARLAFDRAVARSAQVFARLRASISAQTDARKAKLQGDELAEIERGWDALIANLSGAIAAAAPDIPPALLAY